MFLNMRILLNIICFMVLLLNCHETKADITVAMVAPKAGDYAQQGIELLKGAQKAVSEINDGGGLLGKKVSLMTIDDQCSDSIAVSTAQMLSIMKNPKINLVIGPYCANSFEKVADIYAKSQIFQIIPTTVNYSQAKTIKKGLVKMLGFTNQQASDFFSYYNSTFAGEKVAIISNSKDLEGTEEAKAIFEEFRKHGKLIVLKSYTYDMTDKDYDKLAEMINIDGNKVAFILGTSKNIKKMAKSLKEKNDKFVIFTNKYAATNEYFNYLGDFANGTYFMELRGKDEDPEFAETLVKLRLSGFETEGLSLYGYSAIKLWESVVKQANSLEYNALSTKINDNSIKTDFGQKLFHNGTPEFNENYAIYKFDNGVFDKVY